MSYPGTVQVHVNVKKQAEDDTIDQLLQLQQVHQFHHHSDVNCSQSTSQHANSPTR